MPEGLKANEKGSEVEPTVIVFITEFVAGLMTLTVPLPSFAT